MRHVCALVVCVFVLASCGAPANPMMLSTAAPTSPPSVAPPTPTVTLSPAPTVAEPEPTTSGLIESNETWRGTVRITGDISCANGAQLTIEPGTRIIMDAWSDDKRLGEGWADSYVSSNGDPTGTTEYMRNAITLHLEGCVVTAIGTADHPIVFTSSDPRAAPWGNLTSYDDILSYARESYPVATRQHPDTASASWDGIFFGGGELQYVIIDSARANLNLVPSAFASEATTVSHAILLNGLWLGIDIMAAGVSIADSYISGGGHHCLRFAAAAAIDNVELVHCMVGIGVETDQPVTATNIVVTGCWNQLGQYVRNSQQKIRFAAITTGGRPTAWFIEPPDGWMEKVFGTKVVPAGKDFYEVVDAGLQARGYQSLRTGPVYGKH